MPDVTHVTPLHTSGQGFRQNNTFWPQVTALVRLVHNNEVMLIDPRILVAFAPAILVAGVLSQLLFAKVLSPKAKGALAVLFGFPALTAVLALLPSAYAGRAIDYSSVAWDGPASLVFHVDALSVLFAFMATGIGLVVLIYSVSYMGEEKAATRFYALMLTFIAGLVGLVFSANLLLMYVCWEVVGLCSFGLVGFWYRKPEAVSGARKVLLMTHLAGYGFLAAVLLLYMRTGSFLWTNPYVSQAFTGGLFLLMLLALAAKSVQFPLHTWIPEAMAAPTPVSALLHAACYVKAGVYLAARMHSFGAWPASWGATMVWVGTVTMLVGAMYAMVQNDLKRMLAYSTVSQIGYMIAGIGIGTPLGIAAGLLHCLNHGFFKGGLFLAAGSVQHAAGTRDMNQLGGLAQRMPRTSLAWLINMGSMMGIPLLSGFTSKWMLYTAALQAGWVVPALVAWLASVGTVFYCAKATSAVFLGDTTHATEHAEESPTSMEWGMGLMAAGTLVLSVAPQVAIQYVVNPILGALGMSAAAQVSWFGITSSAGSWWATGGFILATVSVLAGALIYFLFRPARVVAVVGGAPYSSGVGGVGGAFTGGEPLSGESRLPASDFSEILRVNWAPFYRWADADRAYLAGWQILRRIADALDQLTRKAEAHGVTITIGLGTIVLACVRWLVPDVADTHVGEFQKVPGMLVVGCGATYAALCAGTFVDKKSRKFAGEMILAGSVALIGLLVPEPWMRILLLQISAAVALLLVWRSTQSKRAKWTYVAVVLFSGVTLLGGDALLDRGNPQWAKALLMSSILAVIPLSLWLLRLAADLPALVLGLIVTVVDVAAFGELYLIAQAAPWVVAPRKIWLAAAIFSVLAGSLLMLVQPSLKRILVLSTLEDFGFLLLGVSSGTAYGMGGAICVAVVHSLAKALLFLSLSTAEADGNLNVRGSALATLYPASGAAFVFGIFAVLGVPPTLGFSGRWRLYEAANQAGPVVALVFVAASACALIAYLLALTNFWWGPPAAVARASREPVLLRVTFVGLILLLLIAGLWPSAVHNLTWRPW